MAKKKKTNPVDKLMNYANKKRRSGNKKTQSLWHPARDGITYSLLSKFIGCRERTRLAYVEGWTSESFNIPLEFGNIFHLMKECKYSGMTQKKTEEIARKYVDAKIKKNKLSANELVELDCLAGLSIATFKEYCKYWNATPTFTKGTKSWVDKQIKFKNLERTFRNPYTLPDGRIVTLTGKIDGELIDPITNKYRVLETKTKGRISEYDIETALKNDTQTAFYMLANKMSFNEMPSGVIYNVIRRTQLSPRKNEPAEDYITRVGSDIRSRPDFYFMRWKIDVSEEDLNAFIKRSLDPLLCQLVDWWESIADKPFDPWTTPDVPTGTKKNNLHFVRPHGIYDGGTIDIANAFSDIVVNGDYTGYYQREDCFPELIDEQLI